MDLQISDSACIIDDMGNIHIFNINLPQKISGCDDPIDDVIYAVWTYARSKLKIDWDVDLVITSTPIGMIPEDGIGCIAFNQFFILLSIDPEVAYQDIIEGTLAGTFCTIARWGKNSEWTKSLFDKVICDGIALYFEAQFAQQFSKKYFFIQTILKRTKEDNGRILEILQPELLKNEYDVDAVFFDGSSELPRWAGYSLGYNLVEKYLNKTNKNIEEAFTDKYDEFKRVLL